MITVPTWVPDRGVDDAVDHRSARSGPRVTSRLEVWALDGLPEVRAGDDLAALVAAASVEAGRALHDGDILVVTSKAVSKAEGRVVRMDREEAITAAANMLRLFEGACGLERTADRLEAE